MVSILNVWIIFIFKVLHINFITTKNGKNLLIKKKSNNKKANRFKIFPVELFFYYGLVRFFFFFHLKLKKRRRRKIIIHGWHTFTYLFNLLFFRFLQRPDQHSKKKPNILYFIWIQKKALFPSAKNPKNRHFFTTWKTFISKVGRIRIIYRLYAFLKNHLINPDAFQ